MIPWQLAHSEILYYLLASLLLPVIIWLIRVRETKKMASIGSNWQNLVNHTYDLPRATIRGFFLMAATACLVISLAKPRDGHEQVPLPTKSKNLMIAVDLSRSMLARDVPPSRLERAKREILDLTELWSPHKIGLIIFAGRAYVHLPLTQDLTMVRLFTKSLSVDMISQQGTDLTAAVKLALSSLTENQNPRTASKDLLIITDGEDNPKEVMAAAQQAKDDGVRIFTMGLGSPEGAPIRLPSGRYQRDARGEIVISKLDESTLISMARQTGGYYVRSEAGNKDLSALYDQGLKQAKAVESLGQQESMAIYHEKYMWPGWLSLIFLVLSFLVTPYRPKPGLKALALSCLALASIAIPSNQAYGLTHPEMPDAKETFRSAARLLADGNADKQQLEEAEQALLSLTVEASNSLLHAVYYNLFHLYLQKNQIKEAHEAILKAYSLKDNHQPTLENLKWIKELTSQNPHSQNSSKSDESEDTHSDNNSEKNQSGHKDSQQSSQDSSESQTDSEDSKAESHEENHKGEEGKESEDRDNSNEHQAAESGDESSQSDASENQPSKSSDQNTEENTDEHKAASGEEGDGNDGNNQASATTEGSEDPDAMGSQQAESLFRSLEENLDIYGRKYHGRSSNRPSKDW